MRLRLVIAFLVLLPVWGGAQVVPAGADPATVERAFGPPRARSAARNREIWTYPEFQVVFQDGRMSSLLERSGDRPPLRDGGEAARPMSATWENGKLVVRSPVRQEPVVTESSPGLLQVLWSALWPYLLAAAAVFVAVVEMRRRWRLWRNQRAVAREPKAAMPREPEAMPMSGKPPSLSDWELPLDVLRALEWKRFELLVTRYYESAGFRVRQLGVGVDGGADLLLFRREAKQALSCVQCKANGSGTVDLRLVRELFDEMAARHVPEGVVVMTGSPDAEAIAFAAANRITLLGGEAFMARFNRQAPLVRQRILREVTTGDYTTPSCPRCGVKLQRHENHPEAGTAWKCTRYPICRYTLTVPAAVSAGSVSSR